MKDFENAFNVKVTILNSYRWTQIKEENIGSSQFYMQFQPYFDTML
jgi:hypothetical protein